MGGAQEMQNKQLWREWLLEKALPSTPLQGATRKPCQPETLAGGVTSQLQLLGWERVEGRGGGRKRPCMSGRPAANLAHLPPK